MATYKSYSSHLGTDGPNPVQRVKPRLVVRRGYAGNETSALSRSLPAGEAIKSGQLVTESAGTWVVAGNIAAAGVLFIAYHDSSDPDVISCNKLLAFDLNGDYEFETGYYTDGGAPANLGQGVALVCGKGAAKGSLVPTTKTDATVAAAVLGYMRGAEEDLSKGQYDATVDNMAQNTEAGFPTATSSAKVIRFVTS
jgi:hypothetical protein